MKLSVITINFNNLSGLKKTAESVLSQTCREFEWVLIDGGSSDGSAEYISDLHLTPNSNIVYSISEKDSGVYNAMNKGISQVHGDYCLFLNSGDILHSKYILGKVLEFGLSADVVYGDVNFVEPSQSHVFHYPDKLSMHFLLAKSLGHPASFIRTSLLKRDRYREDFRIISDWAWFMTAFRNGCNFRHIPLTISDFDMTGISSNGNLQREERKRFVLELLGEQNSGWVDESIRYFDQVNYYQAEDLRMATQIYQKGGKRLALLRFILRILTCYDNYKRK